MLKKECFHLCEEKDQWSPEPLGLYYPLTQEKSSKSPRWNIKIGDRQKSGAFPVAEDACGVSAAISGGPGRYVFKNKERQIGLLQSWAWNREDGGQLFIVSPLRLFHLSFDKPSVKAAIYPTVLQENEEMQFPILGSEHFIYIVSGKAEWSDRETEQTTLLKMGQLLQVSRTDLKREYLNLRLKGSGGKTTLLWVVLHYLPQDKRA
jgi:hypothetical protein